RSSMTSLNIPFFDSFPRYSFIPKDTYSSIAMRYEVNESDLRETNRNKEVQGKSLVILPYGKDAIDKNHK
ncbi:MAG: hypothetical protein RSB94_07900, partial [Erysipelotrichaceae bacterium]